jgi:hypothetical protein
MTQAPIFDWKLITEAFTVAARSFDEMSRALQRMPRIVVTDELLHALDQSGRLGWAAGYHWRHDVARLISYGARRYQRPPRREKRRARKRRGKR